MFLIVDHFEPGGDYDYLRKWLIRYEAVVSNHRDADGYFPQRVFSYPIEQFDTVEMVLLADFCQRGYGDIEIQLHHFDDTEESLREKLVKGIENLQHYGWCQTVDGETAFSFVHGNWSLDDSRYVDGRAYCGVPSELMLLRKLGCYMDVTFPSIGVSSQPSKINSVYYSIDDPLEPKSYDSGIDVKAGREPTGDLLLLQGPLLINWRDWRFKYHPTVENGDLFGEYPPSPQRVDLWIKANIHVIDQPNWIFVKVHAHGARKADSLALFGEDFERALDYLESKYNDGQNYVLHYVTTREAFNIVKAAEQGMTGNPANYRDYILKPYCAKSAGNRMNNQIQKPLEEGGKVAKDGYLR